MKNSKRVRLATWILAATGVLVAFPAASVHAQEMTGRWRVGLRTGVGVRVNSGTEVSSTGIQTTTQVSGLLGALELSHWFSEGWAGTLSVGVLSVGVETQIGAGAVETRTASVTHVLIGVRRYLVESGPQWDTRFFGSVEVGPVTGHEVAASIGTTVVAQAITRTAAACRFGVGADFHLGSRVMVTVGAGLNLMTDFSDPIGGQTNHSGADLGIALGFLFGG